MVVFAVLTLIAVVFFATSLIDAYTGGGRTSAPRQRAAVQSLSVEAFASRLRPATTFAVHVGPGRRVIPGTDVSVSADALTDNEQLPGNLDTELLVYGDTGSAGKKAASLLSRAGYRRVAYLSGGLAAWVAADRPLK